MTQASRDELVAQLEHLFNDLESVLRADIQETVLNKKIKQIQDSVDTYEPLKKTLPVPDELTLKKEGLLNFSTAFAASSALLYLTGLDHAIIDMLAFGGGLLKTTPVSLMGAIALGVVAALVAISISRSWGKMPLIVAYIFFSIGLILQELLWALNKGTAMYLDATYPAQLLALPIGLGIAVTCICLALIGTRILNSKDIRGTKRAYNELVKERQNILDRNEEILAENQRIEARNARLKAERPQRLAKAEERIAPIKEGIAKLQEDRRDKIRELQQVTWFPRSLYNVKTIEGVSSTQSVVAEFLVDLYDMRANTMQELVLLHDQRVKEENQRRWEEALESKREAERRADAAMQAGIAESMAYWNAYDSIKIRNELIDMKRKF